MNSENHSSTTELKSPKEFNHGNITDNRSHAQKITDNGIHMINNN